MSTAPKKKAPSRIRCEQAHPTVSCRVPREVYDRLQAVRKTEGKSFADILKTGFGILEIKGKDEGEARRKGHAEAERLYKVIYPCYICGQTIEVTSTEAKQAVSSHMREHGWGHKSRHQRWR